MIGIELRGKALKGFRMKVKAEVVIAELNRLRSDVDKDMTDPEYFALHHALCFISYKMGEFQRYLDEVVKDGEHP
jgi:hypothetical protein